MSDEYPQSGNGTLRSHEPRSSEPNGSPAPRPGVGASAWNWPSAPGRRRQHSLPEVRIGGIGRGYAGKTALFRALMQGPVGDYLPSGLHLDLGDPKQVAQSIRDAEETQRLLEDLGLPPTLEASEHRYFLFEGDEARLMMHLREVVGQILTHTLPDSAEEQQDRYLQYVSDLAGTHVLWTIVPTPPPSPTPRERRRFANDLRITAAYLQEALRHRPIEKPCAVAMVISKIDSLYATEEEARAHFSAEVMQDVLGPLVNAVNTSQKVADAAIFPCSAFGFGNAVPREASSQASSSAPQNASPQLYATEPAWVLRPDAVQEPFNLTALATWTMLFGLMNQEVSVPNDQEPELARICRVLREDLSRIAHWSVTVKTSRPWQP